MALRNRGHVAETFHLTRRRAGSDTTNIGAADRNRANRRGTDEIPRAGSGGEPGPRSRLSRRHRARGLRRDRWSEAR